MTQTQQTIEDLYGCYAKAASNIISYYHDDDRKAMLDRLRSIIVDSCKLDARLAIIEDTKDQLLEKHDVDENADQDIEVIMKDFRKVVTHIDVNISEDEKLLEYDRQVTGILDAERSQNFDTSRIDEDLQLTSKVVNVIDPISKKRMKDPVKNIQCGHTYDKESIIGLLDINPKTRCPVIGCKTKSFVTKANLKRDIVVQTFLEKNPE